MDDMANEDSRQILQRGEGTMDRPKETLRGSRRAPAAVKKGRSLPKMEPLRGSLHAEMKGCGKPACRCARGNLHGPYWSHRWREPTARMY